MIKNTHKHLMFTKEEIEECLKKFRNLVNRNRYKIADRNREKNINFIRKYNLNSKQIKAMLLEISAKDFCYAADDYKSNDILYIFGKKFELNSFGSYEDVMVYIKINVKVVNNDEYAVIISFHEAEKELKFLFE